MEGRILNENSPGIKKNIPKVLSIEVTTRCNLDCVYCTRKAQQVGNIDISEELIQQIDKEIDKFDRIIICGIGESFFISGDL